MLRAAIAAEVLAVYARAALGAAAAEAPCASAPCASSWRREYSTRQKAGQTIRMTQSVKRLRRGEQLPFNSPPPPPPRDPIPPEADVLVALDALATPPAGMGGAGSGSTVFSMVGGQLTRSGYTESLAASNVRETRKVALRRAPEGAAAAAAAAAAEPAASESVEVDWFRLSGTGSTAASASMVSPAAREVLDQEAAVILQKIVGNMTKKGQRTRAQFVLHDSLEHVRRMLDGKPSAKAASSDVLASADAAAGGKNGKGKQQGPKAKQQQQQGKAGQKKKK